MTIIGIIGAHNRETLQALLNPLLERGGITEVRILKIGDDDQVQFLVDELSLIHEFYNISAVSFKDLISKDSALVEVIFIFQSWAMFYRYLQVIVFINTSFKDIDQFLPVAFSLLKIVYDDIVRSAAEQMYIVFGDNLRWNKESIWKTNFLLPQGVASKKLLGPSMPDRTVTC